MEMEKKSTYHSAWQWGPILQFIKEIFCPMSLLIKLAKWLSVRRLVFYCMAGRE
jgi:hypothetical protein